MTIINKPLRFLTKHPLYSVWHNMLCRCNNPTAHNYQWYGARGITVCDRWLNDFYTFVADMGERPIGYQIDRIDGNLGYSPENCRWASKETQANNQRPNGIGFSHKKTSPMRYISRHAKRWRVQMQINGQRLIKGFADLDDAKEFRSTLEMEREMTRLLTQPK